VAVRSIGTSGRRPLLDDLDKAIIKALQLDGRRPYAQIGRELKVPEATVRQRAERLISRGIVQVVGVTDPLAMGFGQPAFIGLHVDASRLDEVADAVAALEEVTYVVVTAGRFDMICEVVCEDNGGSTKATHTYYMSPELQTIVFQERYRVRNWPGAPPPDRTTWQFVRQEIIFENRRIREAFRHSSRVVRGRWWHTALVALLLFIIAQVTGPVIGISPGAAMLGMMNSGKVRAAGTELGECRMGSSARSPPQAKRNSWVKLDEGTVNLRLSRRVSG
jgi:Lrp/AsnC family transcriptional regulator for asnA, asnC and gidA